jgi:hypothetical protein
VNSIIHVPEAKDFNDQNKPWEKYSKGLCVFGSLVQRQSP